MSRAVLALIIPVLIISAATLGFVYLYSERVESQYNVVRQELEALRETLDAITVQPAAGVSVSTEDIEEAVRSAIGEAVGTVVAREVAISVSKTLGGVEDTLKGLEERLARIEEALAEQPTQPTVTATVDTSEVAEAVAAAVESGLQEIRAELRAIAEALSAQTGAGGTDLTALQEELARLAAAQNEQIRLLQDIAAKLSSLEARVAELESQVEALGAGTGTGQQEEQQVSQEQAVVLQNVDTLARFYDLSSPEAVSESLLITAATVYVDTTPDEIAMQLNLYGRPAEEAVWELAEYMARNLMLMNDTVARYLRPDGQYARASIYFNVPFETLERGGGGSEDLAILAYAVLSRALTDARVYLVLAVYEEAPGEVSYIHGAVVVATRDGRYILLDPTLPMVNGVVFVYELTDKYGNVRHASAYMVVQPLRRILELKYLDHFYYAETGQKRFVAKYDVPVYTDVGALLDKWYQTILRAPPSYYVLTADLFNSSILYTIRDVANNIR